MEFNIDIQSLKQCLTIFGSEDTKASCEMRLGDHGLLISMKENDIITDCELAMFDYQPLIDLDSMFFNDSIMVKIMMHSDWIRTAFMEIDATCEFIEFQVSRDSSELTFSSQGLAGESKIRYPSNSLVMDSFFCECNCSFRYPFRLLQSTFKTLGISTKTSIRITSSGLLCLQVFFWFI
jgi:hypothetical protein